MSDASIASERDWEQRRKRLEPKIQLARKWARESIESVVTIAEFHEEPWMHEWNANVSAVVAVIYVFPTEFFALLENTWNKYIRSARGRDAISLPVTVVGFALPMSVLSNSRMLTSIPIPRELTAAWEAFDSKRWTYLQQGDWAESICQKTMKIRNNSVQSSSKDLNKYASIDFFVNGYSLQVKADPRAGPEEFNGTGNLWIKLLDVAAAIRRSEL